MSSQLSQISTALQTAAVSGGGPIADTLNNATLPSANQQADSRTLVQTALGKLSLLDDYGPNFSETVRSYIRICLDARAQGRNLTQPERAELKKIEDSFSHPMAGNTLRLIGGHVNRLLSCDQKLAKGLATEEQIKNESDKVLIDIDKRLGLLTTWYMQAKERKPLEQMALAAYHSTENTFRHARYSQAEHSPRKIDCSGLVGEYLTRLLKEAGINEDLTKVMTVHLYNMDNPRSRDPLVQKLRKYFDVTTLSKLGIENLLAGDVIVRRKSGEGHTGTYIGDGKVMHSTRDRDQNGYGIDTLHEFLRSNRIHKIIRLKPQYSKGSGVYA